MNTFWLMISAMAGALAGGIMEYILGLFLPEDEKKRSWKHLLALIVGAVVFTLIMILAAPSDDDSIQIALGEIQTREAILGTEIARLNQATPAPVGTVNPTSVNATMQAYSTLLAEADITRQFLLTRAKEEAVTVPPTNTPSYTPSPIKTSTPSQTPSRTPTLNPSRTPTSVPTVSSSRTPTSAPIENDVGSNPTSLPAASTANLFLIFPTNFTCSPTCVPVGPGGCIWDTLTKNFRWSYPMPLPEGWNFEVRHFAGYEGGSYKTIRTNDRLEVEFSGASDGWMPLPWTEPYWEVAVLDAAGSEVEVERFIPFQSCP